MPIDPMMLDAILGTFRNMVEDCRQKNISGEHFDNMCSTFARMEELGAQHSDLNAFNGQIMQENLYGTFSNHYSKALCQQAQQQSSEGGNYDDAFLLKQGLDALRQAIQRLRDNYREVMQMASGTNAQHQHDQSMGYIERNIDKELLSKAGGIDALKKQTQKSFEETLQKTPDAYDSTAELKVLQDPEPIIAPIQSLIELGEQPGMTYPRFLRLQIEQGLDKAAEGSAVTRSSYVTSLEFAQALNVSPHYIAQYTRQVERFDEMAAAAKFGVPQSRELQWAMDDIFREHEPLIIKWDRQRSFWENLLDDLYSWSLSYCSFAPHIQPWSLAKNPVEATRHTQNTQPGIFREREKLFLKYFGMTFMDLFKHETFAWEVTHHHVTYSQVFTEFLIEKIYPHCSPFKHLPGEIIEERASFYKKDRNCKDRELNPLLHLRAETFKTYYDRKFGEGRYLSKFGPVEKNEAAAAPPWNWETFKYRAG